MKRSWIEVFMNRRRWGQRYIACWAGKRNGWIEGFGSKDLLLDRLMDKFARRHVEAYYNLHIKKFGPKQIRRKPGRGRR